MRLLLDTQIGLWWLVASKRLDRAPRELISGSHCAVSVVSIWEVAIKHRLGKLPVEPQRFRDEMQAAGASIIPVTDSHAIATATLAMPHDDPFDRMLVAIAQLEGMILLTADSTLIELAHNDPALPIRGV